MTTIDTTEDIIRILREQPDVREEIRRLILTDELMALPAQFIEMRKEQAEIRQEVHDISQTQTEMQQDIETLKNDMATVAQRIHSH